MKSTLKQTRLVPRMIISSVLSGIVMWVMGGLYHNLILPAVNQSMHPHHEGLLMVLIAYIILGLLMGIMYIHARKTKKPMLIGLKVGVLTGVLWVFPHGLTMAAVHESSTAYEAWNMLYHVLEQGLGGIIIGRILLDLP